MAPYVATDDWSKESRLFIEGPLVAAGPARRWNCGKVLPGEMEELMERAGHALESLVHTTTGVVCGLGVADE